MSDSERLSAFAAHLEWDQLPASVQDRAVTTFIDAISVMFAGAATPTAQLAARFARASGGDVRLVAGGSAAAPQAAMANGTAAAALDFEDGHYLGGGIHPASVVVGALLSTADADTSVKDLLVGLVAGYEVGLRVASLLWPQTPEDWYHTTGTAGAVAAAVACARLRGLDTDGVRRSLVVAWQHAPMATFALPMIKESVGWGAMTGAAAAMMAADGLLAVPGRTGPIEIDGFPTNPLDRDHAAIAPFVRSIGTVFEIESTYFKKYAACRYVHAAAHGFHELLREHGLTASDVAAVQVGTHRGALFLGEQSPPTTLDQAQYSFPHVLAAIAQHGRAGAAEISEASLTDQERRRLAALIDVVHDPEIDAYLPQHYGAQLRVTTTSGRTVDRLCLHAPGDAELPMSQDELGDKWRRCLEPVLPITEVQRILALHADDLLVDVLEPAYEAAAARSR